jgi:hypothetical protein
MNIKKISESVLNGKRQPGDSRSRWVNSIRMDLKRNRMFEWELDLSA